MSAQDKDKSLIEHLEELRGVLIKCFAAIALVLPFAFYFSPKILNLLADIFIKDRQLYYFSPMEVFLIQMKLSFLVSIIITFPYTAGQLWRYLLPALYDNERKFIRSAALCSFILFASGAAFCLFAILPLIMQFALGFSKGSITAMLGVSNVINTALNLSFVFGFIFQIPVIVNLLIRFDIISYESISSKRRYVIVLLLIISALFTPPDIISQIMLFTPAYMLFETGLILSRKKADIKNFFSIPFSKEKRQQP